MFGQVELVCYVVDALEYVKRADIFDTEFFATLRALSLLGQ